MKILLSIFIFLIYGCSTGNNMKNKYNPEGITKDDITILFKSGDDIEAIKKHFEEKHIEYKIRNKEESETTDVFELMEDGDITLFAKYSIEKSGFILTDHAVYMIFDSKKRLKQMIFKTFLIGS
jgi:hypothetical protein